MKKFIDVLGFFNQHTSNETRTANLVLSIALGTIAAGNMIGTLFNDSRQHWLIYVFVVAIFLFYVSAIWYQVKHPVRYEQPVTVSAADGTTLNDSDMLDAAHSLFKNYTPEQAVCKMWGLVNNDHRQRLFDEFPALTLSLYLLEDSRKVVQ